MRIRRNGTRARKSMAVQLLRQTEGRAEKCSGRNEISLKRDLAQKTASLGQDAGEVNE
jgi:hypothetical protein